MASASTSNLPSSKSGTISTTHKGIVRARDGQGCWVCGLDEEFTLNFCYIIPRSLPQRFEMFQNSGYLPSDIHPAHPDNFIVLCANCHNAFDCAIPAIVILPTNMEFFINYEERDYESRTEGEELRPRSFPTAKQYKDAGGMYRAYALSPGFRASTEKTWGGSPAAMIVKASLGVLTPGIDSIPRGTRAQVAKLIELWERPSPTPNTTAKNDGDEKTKQKGRARETKRRSSDSPKSQDDSCQYPRRKRHDTESVKGTKRKSTTDRGRKPAKVVEKPEIMFPNLKSRKTSPNLGLDGAWDYYLGPNMSANDIIAKYTGYRNS